MARHRSPRSRAHRKHGAHRSPSLPIPLRGAAVAAVTGSALSLIAGTVTPLPPGEAATALRLTAEEPDDDDFVTDDEKSDDEKSDDENSDDENSDDGDRRRPSVELVAPEDDRFDVDELLESVKRAEAEAGRAAQRKRGEDEEREAEEAEERAREEAEKARRGGCDGLRTGGLGAVKSHVREAAGFFGCRFGKPTMFGVAGRGGPSDHPGGLAIDFMVNRATGDALAQCALQNMDALGIKYVIWEQQINHGNGWKSMADRGGVTANHFDHVHVSFDRGAGGGDLGGC